MASKTGVYDHTVALDLPRHRPLVAVLLSYVRQLGPLVGVFRFSYDPYLLTFQAAVKEANFVPLAISPLGLRHGGPSYDAALGLRPLLELQQRGPAESFFNIVRYQKAALLSKQLR